MKNIPLILAGTNRNKKKKKIINTENILKYFAFIRIESLSDRTRSILDPGYRYLLISTADAPGRI